MKIILYISCLLSFTSLGQEGEAQFGKLGINVGYFGEFVFHPGMYAGIDYSVWKNKRFDAHWNSEMGFYIHKWNNNSFFTQSSMGMRYTTSFSMLIDLNLGVGYQLSSPNGDVYQVNESGTLVAKNRPVTSHFKPYVSLLFGWNGRKRGVPVSIQLGPELYMQSHVNHAFLPHAALRFGATYHLKSK